jgi:PD-(D/E)XK nuclease superfamily
MADEVLRLSWSRIRSHEECPAQGHLLSQGFKSPVADVRSYYHGNVVDTCMRTWLADDHPQRGGMLAMVDSVFDAQESKARDSGDGIVRWRNASDKNETRVLCRNAVHRLEPLLERICLPYDWDPAVRFSVPMWIPGLDGEQREIALVGEIDLLVRMPKGIINWDLKATRDDNYWRKVVGQLLFYHIAVAAMVGEWPAAAGLIQPLCKEQLPMFAFSKDDLTQMYHRIVKVARDIWSGNVLPKLDNKGCNQCPTRPACPKFPKGRGRVPLGMPQAAAS